MEISLSQICDLLGERIEKYNSVSKKRKLTRLSRPRTSTPNAFTSVKMPSPNLEFSPEGKPSSSSSSSSSTAASSSSPVQVVKSTPRKRAVRRTVGLRARKLVFVEDDDSN
ncbi:unnamed protein product [Colias eurytheme]|nr:unnamed protein product [Colias eurytheme]